MKRNMKIICVLISLFSFSSIAYGQTSITIKTKEGVKVLISDTSKACNKKLIYAFVESMPSYKGGFKTLEKDLNNNINIDKQIKGELRVWFVINCNNLLYGVQFRNELNKELETKLINFFIKQQAWTSGMQRGEKVDCDVFINLKIKKGKIKVLNK